MTMTSVSDNTALVKKFWSSLFVPELLEMSVLPGIVNKSYSGTIGAAGDTVKVTSFARPTATRKTVGSGHETFEVGKLTSTQVEVVADQVITAGFKFDSLAELQSQVGEANSVIRQGIVEAMVIEVNNYLYSLVAPSTSAPDHSIASVSDFNAAQLGAVRTLASQAKWGINDRYLLLDPQYYTDALAVAAMTSLDYVDDRPVVNGQLLNRRYGFWIAEDNSSGMAAGISPTAATSDLALALTPDAILMVTQLEPEFELSSLHSNGQHGFLITARMVMGAKLGPNGSVKHIEMYNT